MGHIIVYITNPTKKTADRIAMHLLKKKLIACANIFGVDSIYRWKGKIEKSKEWMLMAKSKDEKFRKIVEEINKIHPYQVPIIEKVEAIANSECIKWLDDELK